MRVERAVETIAVAAQTEIAETVAGRPVEGTKTSNNINQVQKMSKKLNNTKSANSATEGKSKQVPVNTKATAPQIEGQEPELVILLGKYIVEADFLDEAETQFWEIYPSLLDDVAYSPAEMVGELFWANLTDLGQRLVTLCLKHLATEPDVPLVDLTCECCGKTNFSIV